MDFVSVFKFLLDEFKKNNLRFALIGGFAMHAAGYIRATQDIDFIVPKDDADKLKKIMRGFGYELVHESEDVANYVGRIEGLGQVDFLYANRQYANTMLERALEKDVLDGQFKIKVILPEDLIGLKVQSSSNDPNRYHQDMADIEAVMKINFKDLDLKLIKEYFDLFERGQEFEEIMKGIKSDD